MSCVPQRKIIDHGDEFGSVGERFNPSVLKTEGCNRSVSSNLTASAKITETWQSGRMQEFAKLQVDEN